MNRVSTSPDFVSDALQLIGIPACCCDGGGAVLAANVELVALLGFDPAGRLVSELFARHVKEQSVAMLDSALAADGVADRWDSCLARANGQYVSVQLWVKPLPLSAAMDGATIVFNDISSVHRDHRALRKTLLEQQAILENAAVGILFSKEARIQECNIRCAEMLGYARHELEGADSVVIHQSGQHFDELAAECLAPLAAGQSYTAEVQLRRKDGTLLWCRLYGRAIDPSDTADGTVWIVEDIDDHRRDEEMLRRALLEMQAIMDSAPLAIGFQRDNRILRYNHRFAEFFGFTGDSGVGQLTETLYPSQDAFEAVVRKARPLLARGKPYQAEMEMRRQDGSTFWAHAFGYVINPGRTLQDTIWIFDDRSAQKKSEESLRNALLENQAILDSAVLGISVIEQGHNLRCNTKMEELFGYAPGEMNRLSVRAFYDSTAAWHAARDETARDFRAGRVNMSEYQLVRKDGSRFWARLSGRPFDLNLPNGRSVWLVDDITARREAADAVSRARDELEVRVLERTAELAGANALLQGEIVERRQAEARVHHMAYHDSLTGLPNRVLLSDRLDRAMLAAQRSERRLAVMFLDLDRFKTINDSLGHLTGDQLLKEVASRLCRAVRASDTVARLGGDEFVVLVPGIRDVDEATAVAQKIIDALGEPFPLEARTLHITPSIGVCIYPDDGDDVETLMRHADAAMYHAKASGRNNYQFFTQMMNQAASQHFELESSLRGALALNQFELHFQPIMDIGTRRLNTMEVLLRWRRPGLGLVLPDSFIPIIEENGLIVPIGEWVMRRACEQSMEWARQGLVPVPLAVNLSPRQFMHRGLIESIRRILDETGIAPNMIEFEITETALMQHGEQTLDILGQINAMGIRLSIDDFGTGYSSLAYLKRFPVKKLKIDRAFIKDLEESAEDRAIVAAIIALSNSLQLSVVAEGVETEGQYALLQHSGCQYAQGYLFSQPVPHGNAQLLLRHADQAAEPSSA